MTLARESSTTSPKPGPPIVATASSASPTGPPIASGLWKPSPSGSKRGVPNAVPRVDSATAAAPAHRTGRQRRDGSRPSGNSSGSSTPTSPNQKKITHSLNQTRSRSASPGAAVSDAV